MIWMCVEEIRMNPRKQLLSVDEEEWKSQAMNGDLDAFNQLVLRYQDLAYSHAYALLRDPDLAEDATQESFIKAFQAISGFRGGSFRSWLLKIVTNSAYDMLRRSRQHPSQPLYPEDENGEEIESPPWLMDPASSVEDNVAQKEISNEIYRYLDELPEAFRSVLTLIDIQELDYVEAAEALRIPVGTVKSRLARARLQLRERLNANGHYYNRPARTTGSFAS
jgi:RNA polymerase sigma-70 factor, ECF subfamily